MGWSVRNLQKLSRARIARFAWTFPDHGVFKGTSVNIGITCNVPSHFFSNILAAHPGIRYLWHASILLKGGILYRIRMCS